MRMTDNVGNPPNYNGLRRRDFLLATAGAFAGFLVRPLFNNKPDASIASDIQVTETSQPLTLSQNNASRSERQVAEDAAKRRDQADRLKREYQMTERLATRHPSGLAIKLFSDSDILVPGAASALNQAIGAGLSVLDKLPDGEYKSQMLNVRRKAERGAHSGNELELYVSSRLDTVYNKFSPFDNMQPDTVHLPLSEPSSNGVIYQEGPYHIIWWL